MGIIWLKLSQDSSGTIDRDEFLSLPQVSSNPLATRYVRQAIDGGTVEEHQDVGDMLTDAQDDRDLRRRRRRGC